MPKHSGIGRFEKDSRCWLEQELENLFLVMAESNFLLNIQLLQHRTSDKGPLMRTDCWLSKPRWHFWWMQGKEALSVEPVQKRPQPC